MKLTAIKLSGFKSFVDPTTIHFQGKLNGIVGPNGCGKSNIMDAIRWVLGESRASELRGESMKDVVFSGTTVRKPAGRASVELVFDNSDGRIGGQWGQYTELAVRRVLTREGRSSYSINGIMVRRRDIHDIFMGTGLGPRAYAIIGQGMISRIIEARPEELRIFLEEAAGVSKYKERRKETVCRLIDSQENLSRVLDILAEQEKQLEKLKQHAELANTYHHLSKRRSQCQQFLWLLQKQSNEQRRESLRQQIENAQIQLENSRATIYRNDALFEELRIQSEKANQTLHDTQGDLYGINAEIGRLTAQINYIAETRNRLEKQLAVFETQKKQWHEQIPELESHLNEVKEFLVAQQTESEIIKARLSEQQDKLPEYEEILVQHRKEDARLKENTQQIQQQIAVATNTYKSLQNGLTDCFAKREDVVKRHQQIKVPNKVLWQRQVSDKEKTEQYLQELQYRLESLEEELPGLQENQHQESSQVRHYREAIIQHKARLDALGQIEESREGQFDQWIKENQLDKLMPLWRHMTCLPGWEIAVEIVLSERLKAVALSKLEQVEDFAKENLPGKVSFYDIPEKISHISMKHPLEWRPLSDQIKTDIPGLVPLIENWLCGVYIAPSLHDALQLRNQLPTGAYFIVPEGHRVDRYSVRLYVLESDQEGFFSRRQEMSRLEAICEQSQTQLNQAMVRFQNAQRQLNDRKEAVQQTKSAIEQQEKKLNQIHFAILKEEEQQHYYAIQEKQIIQQLGDWDKEIQEKQTNIAKQEKVLEALERQLVERQEKANRHYETVIVSEETLKQTRESCHELEKQAQQISFAIQTSNQRQLAINRQIETTNQQIKQVDEGIRLNQQEMASLTDNVQENQRQILLDQRIAHENLLAEKRFALDEIAKQIKSVKEERLQAEQCLQSQQEQIVALQLKEQEARLQIEQYTQKLHEVGIHEQELLALFSDNNPSLLQQEITELTAKIKALGPVNLTAFEELKHEQERRQYLQEQHKDLTEAISTLENAIKRIDRETRHQLQATFDQVNQSLDEIFPILFGGGKAQLIMNGDEILDAGIQIMAQPPGKKNATIHLLSGGEKALTALALVFSLFQLNPAPFCLLDEVDAPLDDANTARFSKLVTKMSENTQFLFISHNQIAMEIAEELIGVTMQEKGVSRIVSVNLSDTRKFAEKGRTQ